MVWLAELDVVLLSRIQFAMTIMFHYIFPPLTIGMAVVMVYLEGMYLIRREAIYEQATKFWTKIFALNFAIGVASGIVMEFQFGMNWAAYSRFVGDVFGSALAAEGIFAFFLESGFLAVLVFGWDRVGPKMHFFSTCMVALGSIFSSIWIVVANSWQQTPAGNHFVQMMRDAGEGELVPYFINGMPVMRAEIVDFWALVFNPSTVHRLTHVWVGAFILGSFFIMSVAAWYILKGRHLEFARRSFRGALLFATISSIAALIGGHMQAKSVYETQPAKLAAFEGHFESGPADLVLFGIPDQANQTIHASIAIPGGLSFLVHESLTEPVMGLDRFKIEDQPPIWIPFITWRLMVGLGMFFIAVTLLACFLLWRGRLFQTRWLLWVFVFAVFGAFVANQAGWVAAEVGRQPWIVYPQMVLDEAGQPVLDDQGHVIFAMMEAKTENGEPWSAIAGLRTSDGVSASVSGSQVLSSIIGFGLIYALLFSVWVFVLNHKIQQGPEIPESTSPDEESGFFETASDRPAHRDSLTPDVQATDSTQEENHR